MEFQKFDIFIAIYAGAAFRILPAINRIINLVQAFTITYQL